MTFLPDYHIHTAFSWDSDTSMADMCETAIRLGVPEIAFAEHVGWGPGNPPIDFTPASYAAEIQRCRSVFGDRLNILAGLEIGEPNVYVQKTKEILAAVDTDFVLGSAHHSDGMQITWQASFFEQPMRDACEAYFRQVIKLAEEGDFDVVAHFDYVKRCAGRHGMEYDGPEPYGDLIRTALRRLVERGKGIEINTSPLFRKQAEPCPGMTILRWYRELGGEILTLGSDAHRTAAVGFGFEMAAEMARVAGFRRLATFERRSVHWVELDVRPSIWRIATAKPVESRCDVRPG